MQKHMLYQFIFGSKTFVIMRDTNNLLIDHCTAAYKTQLSESCS